MAVSNSGNLSTFAFAPWATFSPKILSIDPPEFSIEDLDDSDLSSTVFKPTVPAALAEIGDMTIVVRLPSNSDGFWTDEVGDLLVAGVGIDKTVGSATISFPKNASGDATAPTLAGTAYVKSFKPNELNNDDPITGTIVVRFDGGSTKPTYAVGAAV